MTIERKSSELLVSILENNFNAIWENDFKHEA